MNRELAISLKNLRFGYSPDKPVLDVKEFGIARGERIFLYGPSGSGKTSLLSLITGIVSPDEGEIAVLGTKLNSLSVRQRDAFRAAHIGYIFQQFNLIPYLNVIENICLPCWNNKERLSRVEGRSLEEEAVDLLKSVGMDAHRYDQVTQLSVGQQQRVAAVRAMMGRPEIVIADEPTSSLDSDRQDEFISLLLKRAGVTLVFVSHNRELAKHFDRSLSLLDLNLAGERGRSYAS